MKNLLDGIDGWLDIKAEIIDELEERAIEITEYKTGHKKTKKIMKRELVTYVTTSSCLIYVKVPEVEEEEGVQKKFWRIMAKILQIC